MRHWKEPENIRPPEALMTAIRGSALTASALYRRGITTVEAARDFLDPRYQPSPPPGELPGIEAGADRVERAIHLGEKICVWGDFDVDGQTSTTILVEALGMLGADVGFYIPNRLNESHGVHLESLRPLLDEGVRLVVTCDTGISAHEEVIYAKSRGVDFVITDHHELPATLPEAAAVANPRLLAPEHPLSTLPGAGAAYQLAAELLRRAGRTDEMERFLDLVTLGIVADLAILRGESRKLVQLGLAALRTTRRAGLLALLELAGTSPAQLTEEHIGFVIGPRLNALGRLDDAREAVEFFTTTSTERAHLIAAHLESLNARRKLLTTQVYEGALAMIEREPALLDEAALVLAHPSWPGGVVGIVASRLAERYGRPVILIANPDGILARGSARSIDGVDITAAIATQADLLAGYGGHPMAAGMSLLPDNIPQFRRGVGRAVGEVMAGMGEPDALEIDAALGLPELTVELVQDIERLAPFGPGNPHLNFCAAGLTLLSPTPVGKNGEHLQLLVSDDTGCTRRLIWWQGAEESNQPLMEVMSERFDLAYRARSSNYRGQMEVQLEFVDARPTPSAVVEVGRKARQTIDLREETRPMTALQKLAAQGPLQVWCEAEAVKRLEEAGIAGSDRYHLKRGQTLAIWTTPPGPRELQQAIEAVRPEKVLVFSILPTSALMDGFVKRLAGLTKFAISQRGGRVTVQTLAAGTAQREQVVWKGIAWLKAQGYLRILKATDSELVLAQGEGKANLAVEGLSKELEAALDEVYAYRQYFRTKTHLVL